jgi:hypothetical protein
MANYNISDEFVYYCSKCKLNLNHRVVLVDKGIPKRVLCLTCKTDRRYTVASEPSNGIRVKRVAAKKPTKANPEAQWHQKLINSDKSIKEYNINARFAVDNRVKHPTFGLGLVVEVIHPDKIKVFFPDGAKVLKCGLAN